MDADRSGQIPTFSLYTWLMETKKPVERTNLSVQIRSQVLTEAGFRCAVPTCRGILALDIDHIWQVSSGGSNDPANLIALCPTCHALRHRGTISEEAIFVYKSMIVSLSHAFDTGTIDKLIFLSKMPDDFLAISGDGVLQFSGLIAADLATVRMKANNKRMLVTYEVRLSENGKHLVNAWRSGDRTAVETVLAPSAGST